MARLFHKETQGKCFQPFSWICRLVPQIECDDIGIFGAVEKSIGIELFEEHSKSAIHHAKYECHSQNQTYETKHRDDKVADIVLFSEEGWFVVCHVSFVIH